MQILLGLVSRYILFFIVICENFDNRFKIPGIFLGTQTVVERPTDDGQNDSLDAYQAAIVDTVLHEG